MKAFTPLAKISFAFSIAAVSPVASERRCTQALAVDSHIFFASIKPDYLWAYFAQTLVYAVLKPERNEHAVVFWDTQSDERYTSCRHCASEATGEPLRAPGLGPI